MTKTMSTVGSDPWQMALIHRLIRQGFAQARDTVRARPDASRVPAVAEYIQFHLDGLHGHHTSEDEHLWPRLLERVQMQADLVARMEEQHAGLHGGIEAVRASLTAWSTDPTASASDRLADSLDALLADLSEHLAEEEQRVVPLIASHITEREWEDMGKAAFAKFKPNQRFTAMGEMLRSATPKEAERMLDGLPVPIKLIWKLVGRRTYERQFAQVAG